MICGRLAQGFLVNAVCEEVGIGFSTLMQWREKYPKFQEAYTRAELVGFDVLAEQLLSITDDAAADVQRQRLKSDNIKWFLGKRAPKTYGDRIDVNVTQTIDLGQALQDARQRALRPVCDQLEHDDSQVVDFIELKASDPHDTQSGAQLDQAPAQVKNPDGG